jgi:hypothetical protein
MPLGTTYLPRGFSSRSLRLFALGRYEQLLAELRTVDKDAYERAGIDRALAIACDLALAGVSPRFARSGARNLGRVL